MKRTAFVLMMLIAPAVMAAKLPGPLVDTEWLAKNSKSVVILDVRKDTRSFTARPVFKTDKKTKKKKLVKVGGHIPGAILVNYKNVRTTVTVGGRKVQKMIVDKASFERLMQSSGVSKTSVVVIVSRGVSNGDMTIAARLYWQMKYYGHDNMAILNGGTAQWIKDGRKVTQAKYSVRRGNWKATAERKNILATSSDVAKAVKSGKVQLVDTRPISLYLGTWRKKSYVYANGHIPGAKMFDNSLLTSVGMGAKFMGKDRVSALAKAVGVDTGKPTITYCNSGQLAAGSWFVLSEVMGNKNVRLYDGSMHQWTLEKRPVKSMVME